MSTHLPSVVVLVTLSFVACGHPVSSSECERVLERYHSCEIPVTLDEGTCAQRFGRIGSRCAKSFSVYAQCIEQTACTALADPDRHSICKNEYISLDIDCDGADFSP